MSADPYRRAMPESRPIAPVHDDALHDAQLARLSSLIAGLALLVFSPFFLYDFAETGDPGSCAFLLWIAGVVALCGAAHAWSWTVLARHRRASAALEHDGRPRVHLDSHADARLALLASHVTTILLLMVSAPLLCSYAEERGRGVLAALLWVCGALALCAAVQAWCWRVVARWRRENPS